MIWLRSGLYFLIYAVTAVFFSLLGVLVWPLPFRWRYFLISRWAVLNIWLLEKICGITLTVHGQENIPDEPCLILCKHQSAWETLALQKIFPPQVWVLKRELLWIPFFGWGLASLSPIAIDRKAGRKALAKVVEQGKTRLAMGACVVVFPEGTRLPPRTMGRFGIGGSRLAIDAGFPIVPVAHNSGSYWPKRGFLKYPGQITMVIGPPIDSRERSAVELNQQVFDWMSEQMHELEGQPPEMPDKT